MLNVPFRTLGDRSIAERLDLALALGVLVIESGGSTTAAERTFQTVAHSLALGEVFAVWRIDSAAAGCRQDGMTSLVRPVGRIAENFRRVSAIAGLADRVAREPLPVEALAGELTNIRQLGSPYGGVTMAVAIAWTAGLFARLQGGDWISVALVIVAAVAGQIVRFRLRVHQASIPATTLLCATMSAMVAALGMRARLGAAEPATLVASIVYLVPGLPLVNGFADLASHDHLIIGTQRIASAALQCALLAIAVALAVMIVH